MEIGDRQVCLTLYHPMKKICLGLIALSGGVFLGAGCATSNPAPQAGLRTAAMRPPQTGTNIPRQTPESEAQTKTKSSASAKLAGSKKQSKPSKPASTPKPVVKEEVMTRGGFR